ncbi:MAG TPA: histidine phosphotransferase family protein [Caulobacteraceae bacterium]|jgi:histidine phosphotransferase ChpT
MNEPVPAPADDHDLRAVSPMELAGRLAAKLCHDFISPTSALVSGLDLLDDPSSADMREEAMALIASSGRKLEALLTFYRVAFGGSQATELFDARDLEKLARGRFEHARAELDWAVEPDALNKAPARALTNLVELACTVLPLGGVARLEAREADGRIGLTLRAEHPRARLHDDTHRGLAGEPLGEGLGGRWVQPYYLQALVAEAGGRLDFRAEEGLVAVRVDLPSG